MMLVIQTNIPGVLNVWLIDRNHKIHFHSTRVTFHGSDRLLRFIDQTLKRHRIPLRSIRLIGIVRGPGSFTAVRTGIIVANTLAWILSVPVHGVVSTARLTNAKILTLATRRDRSITFVRPAYGRKPNITKPKIR